MASDAPGPARGPAQNAENVRRVSGTMPHTGAKFEGPLLPETQLRNRIAEACRKANTGLFGDGPADDWYQLADAVIAELSAPPPDDVLRKEDLEVMVHRCDALGSESHVIIRHVPTGLVAQACREKSELRNKDTALKALRRALKLNGWTPSAPSDGQEPQVGGDPVGP